MADIDSEIARIQLSVNQSQEAFENRLKGQQADDRSFIAKIIIGAFLFLVFIVVIAVIAGTYFRNWDSISESAKILMAVLGSIMLPVVTLVIGYYFGNK